MECAYQLESPGELMIMQPTKSGSTPLSLINQENNSAIEAFYNHEKPGAIRLNLIPNLNLFSTKALGIRR